jgi:hypothetical protein
MNDRSAPVFLCVHQYFSVKTVAATVHLMLWLLRNKHVAAWRCRCVHTPACGRVATRGGAVYCCVAVDRTSSAMHACSNVVLDVDDAGAAVRSPCIPSGETIRPPIDRIWDHACMMHMRSLPKPLINMALHPTSCMHRLCVTCTSYDLAIW